MTGLIVWKRELMTEEISNAVGAGVESQTNAAPQPQEKTLTQSEVNELVGRIKHEAYQRGQKDAASSAAPSIPEDKLRKMMQEEAAKAQREQMQQAQAMRIVQEFSSKVAAAEETYPGLQQKILEADFSKTPEIVDLVTRVDNTADVVNDLLEHPYKMATLVSSVRNGMPHIAELEMRKLSSSIKNNQKALQQNQPQGKEPLSQVKSSVASVDGNGAMSISELRKQSWLKR